MSSMTFPQAVRQVSALAQARLPEALHGHLQRATALVLHGHVWLEEDGRHALVLASDGETWYPCNGHCTCMGAPHVEGGLCKHRIAVGLYRRASELLTAQAAGGDVVAAHAHVPVLAAAAPQPPLPEAPASVNVRLVIDGHDCQVTLRDTDETRLLARVHTLLGQYPPPATGEAPAAPAQVPICPVHGPMTASKKAPGTFYCARKLSDGSFCRERHPA